MGHRCAGLPIVGCLILTTCIVAGVSIKGSLDDVKDALNKGSHEDIEKDGLGTNGTTTNVNREYGDGSLQNDTSTQEDLHLLNNRNNHVDREDDDELSEDTEDITEDQDEVKASSELSNSKRLEGTLVESSVYKTKSQTIISNLTSSKNNPQHGALVNRKIDTADQKESQVSSEEDADTDSPTHGGKGRKSHRKKRLHPSSTTPSAQLIILVVGAVLACVIITGFIRWRVRRRLNDKKLKQMSERFSAYRGKKEFPKKSSMDTIYECDCEHGLNQPLTRDLGVLAYSEVSQEDELSKLDEDSNSHRFDVPPSIAGSSYCDVCSNDSLLPLRSSKTERDSSPGHHKHRGHRSKSSRHHRRRSHDKKYEQVETVDTESNSPSFDNSKSLSFGDSLFEQEDNTDAQNSITGQETLVPTSQPRFLGQTSQHPPRRVLGSLVDTWRSLSFNRDWVGRMWQEKHGVRRISDVLRGLTTISNHDRESSQQENLPVEGEMLKPFIISTLSEEAEISTVPQFERGCEDNVCAASSEICDNATVSLWNEEDISEQNLTIENVVPAVESDWSLPRRDYHVDTDTSSRLVEAEPSQMARNGTLNSFTSFNDQPDEPPEYDSLLESRRCSMNGLSRGGIEHSRHHRRHRRKHRDRNARHLYSRVNRDEPNHSDHGDQSSLRDHEERDPLANIHRSHDLPSASNLEPHAYGAESMPISNSQTTTLGQGQHKVHNLYVNSVANLSTSVKAVPFNQQEGIVIEQLSDGAQIIYLPPPVLPSYHNDTPPPYHK